MTVDIPARLAEVMPGIRRDLEDLVRIESVSADPARAGEVERSAEATRDLFAAEGFEAEIVRAHDGAPPAVIARKAGPEGAPTVLLYAHHDVQPENDHADWDSPPWEPTERGDRLYGRGAADDKAGIAAHLGAVRIFGDDLPVNLVMFIEGEEEVGSDTLVELLNAHKDRLEADVIVIADSGNWDIGEPALTTSLRGLVRMDVEVRTLTHAVHSGMWGGLVPDSIMALSRLIASLNNDDGSVAIEGLHSGPAADVEYPEARLRAESGAAEGIEWIGTGSVVERLWTQPALSITGLDAPKVEGASNTLVPAARCRISLRIAPGDTTANAVAAPPGPPREARPVGRDAEHDGRRHRRGHADRRQRSGVRRRAGRVRRGVGRHRAGRHGRRRLDPVHRRVPRDVPAGERARHGGRGPRHPGPRRQRGPAPRRVREGRQGRGVPAAQPRRPAPLMATFRARDRSSAVLRSPRSEVWAALTDADLIAKMTPYVTSITVDGDRWVWRMGTIPVLGISVAPMFTEVMAMRPEERIEFTHDPERSDEMTAVTGTYVLADHDGGGTDVSIDLQIACTLPLPGLARPAVERVMAGVVKHMGTVFSRNLLKHLGEA